VGIELQAGTTAAAAAVAAAIAVAAAAAAAAMRECGARSTRAQTHATREDKTES
jgi:hypothetical protein